MWTTVSQKFDAIFMYEVDAENKFGLNQYKKTNDKIYKLNMILQSDNIVTWNKMPMLLEK